MCAGAHATGAEVVTATVTNTGPAAMSKRTGLVALAAAALMMIGSTASAGAREVVRYNAEVQPGTIVVKTAERRLYLVLGDGEAIRYTVAVGRPGKQWQGKAQVNGKYVQPAWMPRQCGSKAPGGFGSGIQQVGSTTAIERSSRHTVLSPTSAYQRPIHRSATEIACPSKTSTGTFFGAVSIGDQLPKVPRLRSRGASRFNGKGCISLLNHS